MFARQESLGAGLNHDQAAVVSHPAGQLLVVAGAGTGKTRALAARVARLIADRAEPDRLLLLTFSRRAAREMIDRVAAVTDRRAAARIWAGTFHSVASRLLRAHGSIVGLSPAFTVLDQGDAVDLLALVRAERMQVAGERRFPRADTIAAIHSRVVNSQHALPGVLKDHFPWCVDHADALPDILREYTRRKRLNNVLDYDDLLLFWRAMLQSPAAGDVVRRRFDHVLVDEYQDTNAVQADILASHCGPDGSLTVVGDDAQAIYGFRAATVENIRGFTERWPEATVLRLEQNYRSTPPVLDVANGMLMLAPGAYEKTLWSERRGRARPRLVTCYDEAAQSRWVVDRVLELREQGIDLRDQAVLFRAAHHSDHLELELARRDVPFVKYGGLRFLEAAHVKDLVALLRVLDNPDDELAWTRVIRSLEGVGPAGARRLLVELAVGCGGPARPLERFLAGDGRLPPVAEDDAALLRESWSACRGHEAEPPVAVQVDALRRFCAAVFPRRYDNPDARLADLEALAATSAEHASRGQLLTELVVDPPERTADLAGPPRLDDDYLILSTIHSAKGGEWRAVTVIHAADGNIPSDMALGQPGGVDEELRLLYVAVTRAMDHLAVTYPARFHVNRRRRDDRHLLAQPSRFVEPVRERFEEVSAGEGAAGVDPPVAVGGATSGRSISREVDDFLERLWGDASGS